MSDDLSNRGPQDAARVNIHEPHEVRYWTKKFNVSATELTAAVEKVGVSAQKIEEYLKK